MFPESTSPMNNCTIVLRFRDKLSAKFIKKEATIANFTPYKNIEASADKTSFQREILQSQKFTTTSQVSKISVASRIPQYRVFPFGSNPKPTVKTLNVLNSSCDRRHILNSPTIPCPVCTIETYLKAMDA